MFAKTQRGHDWDYVTAKNSAEKTRELALLDAAFSKWESVTDFEAQQNANLLANYQAALDEVGDVEDPAEAIDMYQYWESGLSNLQAEILGTVPIFVNDQEAIFQQLKTAAETAADAALRANEAWYPAAKSGTQASYEAGYYSDLAAYLAADAAAYENYVSVVDAAQREFEDEQCRLMGLLQDSINTGVNVVADGTTSLDVQVCFRAGTPVQMADDSIKPVEKILPDDLVAMVDQNDPTGKIKVGRVVRVYHNDPQPLWILRFGELELGVTKEHPFFVYGKGWVKADDLELGDICRNAAGNEIVLTGKEFDENPVPVYNFEVEEGHTYFVGGTKDESMLVHNECKHHGRLLGIPTADDLGINQFLTKTENRIRQWMWDVIWYGSKRYSQSPVGDDWHNSKREKLNDNKGFEKLTEEQRKALAKAELDHFNILFTRYPA